MMKLETAKRSSLFLLELLIAILFFSLSAAVCTLFFVKSHTLGVDAHNLDMAAGLASSYAEQFRAQENFAEQITAENGAALQDDGTFLLFYNDDWEACGEADGCYCLSIRISEDGNRQEAVFSVTDSADGTEIYGLDLKKYTGEKESAA